jgi:ABC-2 type transport system ATP-binding protein
MDSILEVRNLVKRYPGITAVDGISLSIRPGICFGLLGPNGAGKTTTIEIIEDVILATSGEVFYKGKPRDADFREEVGIQFQSTSLLSFLSVGETLQTFRNLYRNPMSLEEVVALCQLEDILDRNNEKISGGQKQRLMLAMALVNDPELIFLDEPTTGLDPQARHHLWDIVEQIKRKGKTVVLTTHYMEEAEKLCDEIAIIDIGKIIAEGTPEDLLKAHCSGATLSIPKDVFPELPETIFSEEMYISLKRFETQKRYEFHTDNINKCLGIFIEKGIDLSGLTVRSQNLEDLFLKLTGRQLRN